MLERLFRRKPRLELRFEQRECVMVPQTPERYALHADAHLAAASRQPAVIDDAYLEWHDGRGSTLRRTRWDRAVIEGRFRYPPQPLAVEIGPGPATLTLTFNDALIPHGAEPPPARSVLTLVLSLRDAREARHELWSVEMESWQAPAVVHWTGA